MIIDAHTHIGKKTIVASAEDLVASMNVAGIDKSLVFAGKINEQATKALLDDIAPFKGRLYGIGSVSPLSAYENQSKNEVLGYIEECFQNNLIHGLKFYLGYEHFYSSDECAREFLELCVKYDRPAIFHTGDLYNKVKNAKLKYAHPLTIDDLAVDMPDLKIVMAHMGNPFVREAAEVCYKNDNVFTDCSGFVYEKFSHKDVNDFNVVFDEFIRVSGGTSKIIFGTDWPIADQADYIEQVRWQILMPRMGGHEIDQILGNRAAELFGID